MYIPSPSGNICHGKDLVLRNGLVQETATADADKEFVLAVEAGSEVLAHWFQLYIILARMYHFLCMYGDGCRLNWVPTHYLHRQSPLLGGPSTCG